jgi:hypothetical protein
LHSSENAEPVCFAGEQPAQLWRSAFVICDLVIKGSHTWPLVCRRNHAGKHVPKLVEQRLTDARLPNFVSLLPITRALMVALGRYAYAKAHWERMKGKARMGSILSWTALVVAGVALLIAVVGAIPALLWRGQASSEGNDALPNLCWLLAVGSLPIMTFSAVKIEDPIK